MPSKLDGSELYRRASLLAIRLATALTWASVGEGHDSGDVLTLVWAYVGGSRLCSARPYCLVQRITNGTIEAMTVASKEMLFIAIIHSSGSCEIVATTNGDVPLPNNELLFGGVHGMAVDDEGRLYVTSGGRILRFDPSTQRWSHFAPPSSTRGGHYDGLAEPEQLWFDVTTRNLYVADWGSDRVVRFDSAGSPKVLLKNIGGVRQAICLSDGRLAVVDGKNVTLWKSTITFDCLLPGSDALECPVAIAYDRSREILYILDASPAGGKPIWCFRLTEPSCEVVSDLSWIEESDGVLDDSSARCLALSPRGCFLYRVCGMNNVIRIKVCDGRHALD